MVVVVEGKQMKCHNGDSGKQYRNVVVVVKDGYYVTGVYLFQRALIRFHRKKTY